MLRTLKELLSALIAPIAPIVVYLGTLLIVVKSIFKDAKWGLYTLVFAVPQPNIWYRFHDYPFGKDFLDVLIGSTAVGVLVNKNGFARLDNSRLLFIFCVVNYLALWNASLRFDLDMPVTTRNILLPDLKNYVEMIFLYFLAGSALREEKHQKTAVTLMAFVVFLIAFREFRNFSAGDAFSYDSRAEGPFWIVGLGANHIGAFMACYGAMMLGVALVDDSRLRRNLAIAATLFGLHPLFFSYSRGAYVAALMVLVFYAVVHKRSLLLVVAVLMITWQTVLPPTMVERIMMTETASGELESSAEERIQLWAAAMQLFKDNPIFGIGFGSFGFTRPEGTLTDVHNFYLRTACEQGVIGVGLFAAVLGSALLSGWRLYRRANSRFHRGLGLGFMGCVVAEVFTNMFGDRWSYFVLGGYFFLFWGLVDRAIVLVGAAQPATVAAPEAAPPALMPVAATPRGSPQTIGAVHESERN